MSTIERRRLDSALREVTSKVVDTALEQIEAAADPNGNDVDGNHACLAYLNWLAGEVETWRGIVMQCIEDPPDVTGNPWSDCICNDARYVFGHMESCPAYGRTPDEPDPPDADGVGDH
jgi:hypothetical protein